MENIHIGWGKSGLETHTRTGERGIVCGERASVCGCLQMASRYIVDERMGGARCH